MHLDIWKHYQSTSKAHAQVLQNLIVHTTIMMLTQRFILIQSPCSLLSPTPVFALSICNFGSVNGRDNLYELDIDVAGSGMWRDI